MHFPAPSTRKDSRNLVPRTLKCRLQKLLSSKALRLFQPSHPAFVELSAFDRRTSLVHFCRAAQTPHWTFLQAVKHQFPWFMLILVALLLRTTNAGSLLRQGQLHQSFKRMAADPQHWAVTASHLMQVIIAQAPELWTHITCCLSLTTIKKPMDYCNRLGKHLFHHMPVQTKKNKPALTLLRRRWWSPY